MSAEPLRYALSLYFLGGLLMLRAWTRYGSMRRVQDTARSRAASAPQGRVELQGVAWPEDGAELDSPSGAEVVYYALELQREETRGSGRSRRKEWVTVAKRRHAPDFFLVDATGLVRVPAAEADLDIGARRTRPWRSLTPAERERVVRYLGTTAVPGFPPSDSFFGLFASKFRLVESEIPVGSPLYANGDFRTTAMPEAIHARGLAAFRSKFFDAKARTSGGAAAEEPSIARELSLAAATVARTSAAAGDGATTIAGRIGRTPSDPLYVADRQEEQLATEWTRTVHYPGTGGLALVCAATWLLLATPDELPLAKSRSHPAAPVQATAKSGSAAPDRSSAASAAPDPNSAASAASRRSTSKPATDKPLTGASLHESLRGECFRGTSAACVELLARADELGMPAVVRAEYTRRACELGVVRYCPPAAR